MSRPRPRDHGAASGQRTGYGGRGARYGADEPRARRAERSAGRGRERRRARDDHGGRDGYDYGYADGGQPAGWTEHAYQGYDRDGYRDDRDGYGYAHGGQAGYAQDGYGWDGQGWGGGGWDEPGHAPSSGGGRSGVYRARTTASRPGRGRRRTPRWALVTLIAGSLLALVSGGTAVASALLIDRYAGNIEQDNLLGAAAAPPGEELTGPINILLLGTDGREQGTDDTRSDTVIVLHVPSTHDQAYLISVPRDTWVSVPGYWDMKITEAFYHGNQEGGWTGGARLVAESLHQLTDLTFNAAAIVNFGGFEKIINEMGGVEFCVDTPAYSEHLVLVNGERMGIGRAQREGLPYEQVRYEVGCQHMEGWQALDYARQRKTLESGEGDYGRQRHQQQLLQAMADQATSGDVLANVKTLDGLIRATGDALILDTNGVELVDFAFTVREVRPGDMVSLRTNEGWYNSANIDGVSAEVLTDQSLAMFHAAASDTMAEFLLQHPDALNTD